MQVVARLVLVWSLFAFPQVMRFSSIWGAPSRWESTSWSLPTLTVHASVITLLT